MTIQQAYTRWSGSYDADRNLTRDLDQVVTRRMLGAQRCAAALELGCGTGKNTTLLATVAQQVLALDFSEGMLAQARRKLRQVQVQFVLADLLQPLPCAGQCVDLVTCNLVLEHIEDLTPLFAEAHRVLRAGGVFFVSELHPFRQYQGKKAVFQYQQQQIEIPAYVHHLSAFFDAGTAAGFTLNHLGEWWHEADQNQDAPPRLVTFRFMR